MKKIICWFLGLSLLLIVGVGSYILSQLEPRGIQYAICTDDIDYELLTENGGRVDWSKVTGKIAFDSVSLPEAKENGFHLTYTMDSDGSNQRCVSCGLFPDGYTVGNPVWGPKGRWLAVQVANNSCGVNKNLTSPGGGFSADLYAIDTLTGKTKLLHDVPCNSDSGVLHSHFDSTGNKLSWSEVVAAPKLLSKSLQFGSWKLMTADVVWESDGPRLENIQGRVPGIPGWYENHGFSNDGSRQLYTAINQKEPGFQQTTISEVDLITGQVTVLATTGFNEHAKYTGDDESVIFMSDPNRTVLLAITGYRDNDYHIARRDGSNRCQLTTFNQEGLFPLKSVEGHPSEDFTYAVTDLSFGPEKNTMLVRMIVNSGFPLPVGNLGANDWIVKVRSPLIASGLEPKNTNTAEP